MKLKQELASLMGYSLHAFSIDFEEFFSYTI